MFNWHTHNFSLKKYLEGCLSLQISFFPFHQRWAGDTMRPAAQETVAAVPVPAPETTACSVCSPHDYTGAPCQASTEKGARCGRNWCREGAARFWSEHGNGSLRTILTDACSAQPVEISVPSLPPPVRAVQGLLARWACIPHTASFADRHPNGAAGQEPRTTTVWISSGINRTGYMLALGYV